MTIYRFVLPVLVALLVSNCATTMENPVCRADWRMTGMEDGASGHPVSFIDNHRQACAEYGVQPDLARYRSGHQTGLAQFCTAGNGFKQGRSGRQYNEICPAALRDQFVTGYNTGNKLNQLSSEINHMRQDAELKKSEMSELEARLENIKTVLVAGGISVKDRETLLEQYRKLQTRLTTLENEITNLDLAVARRQQQYEILDSSHGFY